jgi:hypothetical protein
LLLVRDRSSKIINPIPYVQVIAAFCIPGDIDDAVVWQRRRPSQLTEQNIAVKELKEVLCRYPAMWPYNRDMDAPRRVGPPERNA